MVSEDLTIFRKVVVPAREFYVESVYGVSDSLKECADAGMNPLFMPDLAFARTGADKGHRLWHNRYLTPSVCVSGRTKEGNPVVVYGHVPTSLINPDNIRKLINENKLVNGAGPMENDEFYSLLGQEGNGKVFVVDCDKLRRASSGVISVDDAFAHPRTVPFLGGEQVARAYLDKHEEVYGGNIGVWGGGYNLGKEPLGRLLCVGGNKYNNGLFGDVDFISYGRFLGVAPTSVPLENKVLK